MAIIASASAKTSAMTIAVNIFGALEGFLPRDWMLAKLPAANTAEGPRTHKVKIITSARFLLIY
jgi:hypothetical protein